MLLQIREVTMYKKYAIAESCEPIPAGCNGPCVTIKPDKPATRTASLENSLSVPTVPHRAVKIDVAILPNKPKQDLFCHDW
jgi:hypothetical protein